jgi:prepilin-type N-terminal cleavage/methylation domain-containing protein
MKTLHLNRAARGRGFTLVELLVVIAIIAVLAAIAVPAYNSILKKMKNEQARVLAMSIANGIKSYYAEYNKFPLPQDSTGSEVGALRTDEVLTSALLATDLMQNPKKIRFLPDLKDATESGSYGLKMTGDQPIIVDPWGQEYHVIMDADYSGDVENPNPAAGAPKLFQTVLVFSGGPDKDPSTWNDNVMSWAAGKGSTNPAEQQQQQSQ